MNFLNLKLVKNDNKVLTQSFSFCGFSLELLYRVVTFISKKKASQSDKS